MIHSNINVLYPRYLFKEFSCSQDINLFLAQVIVSDIRDIIFLYMRMLHDKDALPTFRYIINYSLNTILIVIYNVIVSNIFFLYVHIYYIWYV